jgi:sugar diacid utilization regulator
VTSASEPAGDDPPEWLVAAARRLFPAGAGATDGGADPAGRLGDAAAEAGVALWTVVTALLDAAGAGPDPPVELVAVRRAVVDAMAGYRRRTDRELAEGGREREEFVTDLLTGRADPGRLAARAQRYGIRLAGPHTVAVVRAAALGEDLAPVVDEALAARFGSGNTLTSRRGDELVCIYAGGLRGVPAELAHLLVGRLGPGTWQVGVGRSHAGAAGLATSLDEARSALDLAARLGFTAPVLQAADLLVFPVLLRDRDAIRDLIDTVLGPLRGARGGPGPLLETLTVLFDHQGNQTATARALRISVRAVTYRLDRIKALTGYHPGEPTQRFTLQAAVIGARLLGWPAADQTR